MNNQKQTNTQETQEMLRLQMALMNHQLRSIRLCCNFVVAALVLYFLAFVWQVAEFYASVPIEQY